MSDVHERLRENFECWEARGRGMLTFDEAVRPTPPYAPFPGHVLPLEKPDDGVRHSALSSLASRLAKLIREPPPSPAVDDEDEVDGIEPCPAEGADLVELRMRIPMDGDFGREAMTQFLDAISCVSSPVTFEVIGTASAAWVQWTVASEDEDFARSILAAHFPDAPVSRGQDGLRNAWEADVGAEAAVVEFALGRYFMQPLALPKSDPMVTLFAALESCGEGAAGIWQVTFCPLFEPWEEDVLSAVSRRDGKPFFDDGTELQKAASQKVSQPLFGVTVRLAARAESERRARWLVGAMAATFSHFSQPGSNELRPLADQGEDGTQEEDLLARCSRRSGMILNRDELACLVRPPGSSVSSSRLLRLSSGTRAAPSAVPLPSEGLILGKNSHDGGSGEVWLSADQRVRHMHILGASGTGKSTLLLNLIRQDLEAGTGFAVLDPHGDLIDAVLRSLPEDRIADVVLLDPADEEYSVGFNILSAHSDAEKTLLASDLVSVFQRLSTSWGDQMGSVFGNAVRAFLESRTPGTLGDLRMFLLDAEFRRQFLESVDDPDLLFYWERAFPQLGGNKSVGPILTRLETFLAPKSIRHMVSQKANRLDFAEITGSGKVLLARLSQGLMGRENSYLLGSLLVAKFQQAAMARQHVPEKSRRLFTLYVDEFQNFITPSMAEILSGARKYRLSLVLAHQELAQLGRNEAVGSAVLANAGTRVVFRVGDSDARELSKGFAHFEAEALQSLGTGQAIARIERSDHDFNLSVEFDPGNLPDAEGRRQAAIASSRSLYATPRAEIEAEGRQRLAAMRSAASAKPKKPAKTEGSIEASPRPETPRSEPVPDSPPPSLPKYETTAIKADLEELGRGGEIHKAAQAELKRLAEDHGFKATLERKLPGSLDTVDLYLERDGAAIACEISVTNTLEYELRNVAKCLRAGAPKVLLIAVSADKHRQFQAAVEASLSADDRLRVLCLMKKDFGGFLASEPTAPAEAAPLSEMPALAAKVVKGWKVRTTGVATDAADADALEQELAAALAETIKRRRVRKKK